MNARFILTFALLLTSQLALAENSPVGLWRTIDDKTNQPRSIVRIIDEGGELKGIIEKGLLPGEDGERLCEKCDGARKNQRIVGMTFMWGLKQVGRDYKDGEILDPDNGKVYSCKLSLSEDGKKLNLRAFIGVSLFGRTQVWVREP